jgi:hypothetical protein
MAIRRYPSSCPARTRPLKHLNVILEGKLKVTKKTDSGKLIINSDSRF